MYQDHRCKPPIGRDYVRNGQHPLRESPTRCASIHRDLSLTNVRTSVCNTSYANNRRQSPLRDLNLERERNQRYHASRLATEVALLKFNTPYEKREHSPSTHLGTKTTAAYTTHYTYQSKYMRAATSMNTSPAKQIDEPRLSCQHRGRSPLQDMAYRPSPQRNSCVVTCISTCHHHCYCHQTSITRPSTLLPSASHNVLSSFNYNNALDNKHSPTRCYHREPQNASGANGYPRRESPLRGDARNSFENRYSMIERDYLKDKLQN